MRRNDSTFEQKEKIRRLLQQPRWKIALFKLVLNALLLWQAAVDYYFYLNFNFLFARRAFFKRTKQRAHWVGSHVHKPHRLAGLALALLLLIGMANTPGIRAALLWSTAWGALLSLYVIVQSLIRITSQGRQYQRLQN